MRQRRGVGHRPACQVGDLVDRAEVEERLLDRLGWAFRFALRKRTVDRYTELFCLAPIAAIHRYMGDLPRADIDTTVRSLPDA